MADKKSLVSYGEIMSGESAKQLLMQAPPVLDVDEAVNIALQYYDVSVSASKLAGERDSNFLLKTPDQTPWVLKIINQNEADDETDVQIQVLKHLQKKACVVQTPTAIATHAGEDVVWHAHGGQKLKVRAYTFLSGLPVNQVSMTTRLQHSFGQTAAQLSLALQDFDHPVLERVILWDVMQLAHLQNWAEEVLAGSHHATDVFILGFFKYFNTVLLPKLQQFPQYAIHGDLSQSNMVVSADNMDAIVGVLDFGDMVKAPRIVELGIAASYALDSHLDMAASLQHIVAGFESVCVLETAEKEVFLDVVVARLVQRIVISTWRAQRFPDNATYILRGTAHARAVLEALIQHPQLSICTTSESFYE